MNIISFFLFLAASICFVKLIIIMIDFYKFKVREKQLAQLKQIYLYFMERNSVPEAAKKRLTKDIKIENGWLYTNYFFFDLKDENSMKKIKKYLMEIMGFYLEYKHITDENTLKSIIEFKKELNAATA